MIRHAISVPVEHRVAFTRNVFDISNAVLADLLREDASGGGPTTALALVDDAVARAHPNLRRNIEAHARAHVELYRLAGFIVLPGGEVCKNRWASVEQVWKEIEAHGLDRHSQVWIIGGGAFLDMAGFAASTAHRGVLHVRFPTTTLSQGDGGVGVKNGVNYFGKKNWVGAFAVPHAVVNDFAFLECLPAREKRAGLIECVKVALIRDAGFFEGLEQRAEALGRLEAESVEYAVRRGAEIHCQHIATSGDPFEKGSARPLDFGHWSAHKLEQISGFEINHGEAVAIGMAVDLHYAVLTGLLAEVDADRALSLISGLGFHLYDKRLRDPELLHGLEEFREHLGGALTVTMVTGIGRKIEIHELRENLILQAIARVEETAAARSR